MQGRIPGKPSDQKLSPKALAAIAEAARRSREAGVGPDPRLSRPEVPRPYGPADEPVTAAAPPRAAQAAAAGSTGFAESPAGAPRRRARPLGSGERRLRLAIGIAAGVLLVVVAALVGTATDGHRQTNGQAKAAAGRLPSGSAGTTSGHAETSSTSSRTLPRPGRPNGQARAATGSAGPTSSKLPSASAGSTSGHAGTSSTSSTLAKPSGPPVLSALAPSSGQAGQTVTVTGSNFLSPSGQISAEVGGQTVQVACPDQTTCSVLIPPNQGSTTSASVTITTDSGTSNPLVFAYGSLGAPAVASTAGRPSPGLVLFGAWRRGRTTGGRCTRCREG